MTQDAEVIEIDNDVEENVTLKIGRHVLSCFMVWCHEPIEAGKRYPADLGFFFFDEVGDDWEMSEVGDDVAEEIVSIDDAWGYSVTGTLRGEVLHVGDLRISDEILSGLEYLDGRKIKLRVDRLQVSFDASI
ncbi:hypothetical protein GAO09_23410 [Rhizobiales bacterium RZME27]|uniref:Uncharacterized protein n=1 Tax=Endobacterium cereale TaxID=2663029 RepID=A0A6A8ACF3_9HYPH|nr:hypothetical protein [Endobacterium cereale]MEB2845384.1 hypothetical protein [Endobacterium cereale]MQY48985.1 hypothetical protein [Endobacterium cereale]